MFKKFEVIGALPIVDAKTSESVRPGGVVELDLDVTNVAALISGGSLRELPAKKLAGKGGD